MNKILTQWKLRYVLISVCVAALSYSCSKSNSEQLPNNCRMLSSSGSLDKAFYTYDENHKILSTMYIDLPKDTGWENYHYTNGHVAYMIRIYQGTLRDTIFYTYDSGK